MKQHKFILSVVITVFFLLFASCQNDWLTNDILNDSSNRDRISTYQYSKNTSDQRTVLGELRENPYSVENLTNALV